MIEKKSVSEKPVGKLIAVEGLDGSGKSPHVYLLKCRFEMRDSMFF